MTLDRMMGLRLDMKSSWDNRKLNFIQAKSLLCTKGTKRAAKQWF